MEGTIWSGRINNLSFANEYLGNLNTRFNLRNLSFLIDETGHLIKVWKNVRVNGHVDKVLTEVIDT